jgi:chromosome segregation ATPase
MVGLAVASAVALVAVVSAQATRSGTDGTDQLLSEVKALRAELRQASRTSMRMQLLIARLSLQEQRVAGLVRQAAEIEARLSNASRDQSATSTHLEQLAAALQNAAVPAGNRRDAEVEIAALQARVAEQQQEEQRLRGELDQVSRVMATEQARWTGFNDELDRLQQTLDTPAER